MRTSLNETRAIDEYLLRQASEEDAFLFEAKLILHPGLRDKCDWQQKTYELILQYSRRQLRAEIEAAQRRVFADRSFMQKIRAIFS